MAVNGITGLGITGTLGNSSAIMQQTKTQNESNKFENLLKKMQANQANLENNNSTEKSSSNIGISSSQILQNNRLNGDYIRGFYGIYTNEADKNASPQGFAANSLKSNSGKKIVIDKTSELYAQSMEMENYMVKMMLSSMRNTISRTNLSGEENSYARNMYEDMMYDNLSESITKNAGFGLADQIYIQLSGQR